MVKLPRLSDVTGRVNCSTEMAKEEEGEEPMGRVREGGAEKVGGWGGGILLQWLRADPASWKIIAASGKGE